MTSPGTVTVTWADGGSTWTLASSKTVNASRVHIGRCMALNGMTPNFTLGIAVTLSRCPSWAVMTSPSPMA